MIDAVVGGAVGAGVVPAATSIFGFCGRGGVGVALPVGSGRRAASPDGKGLRAGLGDPSLGGDSLGAKPGSAVRPGPGDASV